MLAMQGGRISSDQEAFARSPMRERLETTGTGEFGVVIEFAMAIGSPVAEFGEVGFPSQVHIANGAISLFGDNDFSLTGVLGTVIAAVVILFAVDKHDNIRILLDCA